MRHTFLLLLITISAHLSFSQSAQISYKISSYDNTPKAFQNLLLSNAAIENNDTINEEILDLVNPMVLDSVLGRKKEHHQVFLVGWLIHAFGNFNWRAVSMTKEKFVGTVRSDARNSEEEYTEYDIDYDLNFHLKKYLNHVFKSYDTQKGYHRQDVRRSHRTNYETVPFVRDTNDLDIKRYRMHCEMTPPAPFRVQLHYLFFPTQPGLALKDHPNFGTDHPSMGFYGASCLDCNHNCHPELHPYEWTWWLNLHGTDPQAKTWLTGLFYESSNRFRHWSHTPKVGKISIPFAFAVKEDKSAYPTVTIEHLVINKFVNKELDKLNIPDTTFDSKLENRLVTINDMNGAKYGINIVFKNMLLTEDLKYWLSDINWDAKNHILSGYFNFATAVKELYTSRIIFKN